MNRTPFAILLAIVGLCAASCTKSASPAASGFLARHIGEFCTVQFRRDALGAAAALPISPDTGNINGATVMQNGKLLAVEGAGIVIEGSSPRAPSSYWIPYHAILSVEIAGHQ